MGDDNSKSVKISTLVPPVTGSTGEQSEASRAQVVAEPYAAFVDQTNLGAALTNYIDVRSAAVSSIAIAAYSDAIEQAKTLVAKVEAVRKELFATQQRLQEERETRLLLEERERARSKMPWLEKVAMVTGGIFAGAGLPMLIQGQEFILGGVLTGAGIVFVLLGLGIAKKGGAR